MPKSMPDAAISFPMLGDFLFNPKNYIAIGNFKVYWYGIIIATGFLFAVIYGCKRAKQFGVTADNILDVIIFAVPAAIICARIYYVVFNWSLYADDPIKVFSIRDGGLGMYGVIIGAVTTLVIYCRKKKVSILAFLDVVCICFLLAQGIGRWGNFMNREAFGYQTEIFCRMGLTQDGVTYYVHPTFLYESLWNLLGFVLIHFISKKRKYDGQMVLCYMFWYGLGRMMIEGLRQDSLMLFGTGIRVSQLVSGVLFVTAICLLLYNRFKVEHDVQDMFVNRKLAAEAAGETPNDGEETEAIENSGNPIEVKENAQEDNSNVQE